jgi:argininosuccinate lyase
LPELTLAELQQESPAFAPDVYAALDPETAVERRALPGGPARAMVAAELDALRVRLSQRGLDASAVARRFGAQE